MDHINQGPDALGLGTDQYLYRAVQREQAVRRAWLVLAVIIITGVAAFIAVV